jgi:hypothetical protein
MQVRSRQRWVAIRVTRIGLGFAMCFPIGTAPALAQSSDASDSRSAGETAVAASLENVASNALTRVTCVATSAERTFCGGDASAGVVLIKSNGPGECLLGRTWGYDQTGVWVRDGCSGEFAFGASVQQVLTPATAPTAQAPNEPTDRIETWGEFDPGAGFLLARTDFGELSLSTYALVRWVDQMPGDQTFTDHFGNVRPVDPRNDIYPHRVIIFLKGWLWKPKLIYNVFLWTVNTTDQDAIFAAVGYQFTRRFSLYAGLNGTPGTRSLQGSHPFWLGHDRVMADEFFRPYFSNGVWAQGELFRGFWYNGMVANNNSALGIKATQLDRHFSTGVSVWWMPTTKEFGPRGAFGDWEHHDKLATRIGVSAAHSREQRYTDEATGAAGNTTLKLADSLNVFDIGALAPGVTVDQVDYRVVSIDAGVKYHGVFLQTEIYARWLNDFVADGPVPVDKIVDQGFYVQGAFYPVRQKLELYGATSQIYGDKDAGFDNSSEYLAGLNFYPANTRNHRLNLQVMNVNHSPVSSTFGYYTGGQDGTTVTTAFSIFF